MITVEDVKVRWGKVLQALEEKRRQMTGEVSHAAMTDNELLSAHVGNILMTLSVHGNTVEPGTLSRAFAMAVMMAHSLEVEFPGADTDFAEMFLDERAINYVSRMKMSQLVAMVASDLTPMLSTVPDAGAPEGRYDIRLSLTAAAFSMAFFAIMHGMNELELVTDIPSDLDVRI